MIIIAFSNKKKKIVTCLYHWNFHQKSIIFYTVYNFQSIISPWECHVQVIDNSTNQETALDSLFTFLLRFIHARLMGVCQSTNQETVLSHIASTCTTYRISIARSRMVSFLNPNPSEIWHLISSNKHIFCHFQTSYLPKK